MIQNPSSYQLAIFDCLLNTDKNILINATAGSGKTTTIVSGCKLLPNHISSTFLAFNKSIVEELIKRLPSNIVCKTAHSYGMSALTDFYKINFKVNPLKNLIFIEPILALKKDLNFKQKTALTYSYSEAINLIRMNMIALDAASIGELCLNYNLLFSEEEIADIVSIIQSLEKYNRSFSKKNNMIDFTDMIYLSATNPKIRFPNYDMVMVDECQDLNKSQQLMIEKLIKPKTGRLITIGDKNQSIYGFSGSDGNSFEYFANRPNTEILPLSTSYRCAKNIVIHAKKVYPDIDFYEKNEPGEVRDGSLDEVMEGDMVICRNTMPLVHAYFYLLEKDMPATVVGRDIEIGLNKILSKVINCDIDKGLERLDEELIKLKQQLKLSGISNASSNKKVVELHEQITVIKILTKNCTHMSHVESKIIDMFKEKKANAIKLMTIHRSKGLESNRVFVIESFEKKKLMPSRYAELQWELIQEQNIMFVAYTRAKKSLIKIHL